MERKGSAITYLKDKKEILGKADMMSWDKMQTVHI